MERRLPDRPDSNTYYSVRRSSLIASGVFASTVIGSFVISSVAVCSVLIFLVSPGLAADDLKLKPGISFTQDLDNGFPITGTNLDDCRLSLTSPTVVFFGASGDLNTNRQAKRIVDLYHKLAAHSVKFVLIDVDHPANDDARSLIRSSYHGYIPGDCLFNKEGKSVWTHDGEVELTVIKSQIDKCL